MEGANLICSGKMAKKKSAIQNLFTLRIMHIFIPRSRVVCRHGSKQLELRFINRGLLVNYETVKRTTRVTHSTLHKIIVAIASK